GVSAIRALIERPAGGAAAVLERRLREIDEEIRALREHRRGIRALLGQQPLSNKEDTMTKDKWVSIMKAAGFSTSDMDRWHAQVERSDPEEHQEFLEYLHIPQDEIRSIRATSRTGHEKQG